MVFKFIYAKIVFLLLLFLAGMTGLADYSINYVTYKWDVKTEEHLDELLVNAGAAYAVSRGLNAVISVIQASDINILIGNLALGEALDPVNDIVERFSNVMLMSITSIGIQKFIFRTGKAYGVNLFLTLAFLFLLTSAFFESLPFLKGERVIAISNTMSTSMVIIFALFRFIIPTVTLLSLESEKLFGTDVTGTIEKLEEIKNRSHIEYNTVSDEFDQSVIPEQEDDKNFLTRISDSLKDTGRRLSETFNRDKLSENIDRVIKSLGESIEYITDLIVIFIIQTIVIPILTFFLLKASFQPLIILFLSGFRRENP
ncbi:MAG: hypothetical protein JEY91_15125 [Spirochaetaceae bacterium]|nr:hypothetical protein [Spirochaetaceae bacterium]